MSFRSRIAKLALDHPGVRRDLIPLLKQAAMETLKTPDGHQAKADIPKLLSTVNMKGTQHEDAFRQWFTTVYDAAWRKKVTNKDFGPSIKGGTDFLRWSVDRPFQLTNELVARGTGETNRKSPNSFEFWFTPGTAYTGKSEKAALTSMKRHIKKRLEDMQGFSVNVTGLNTSFKALKPDRQGRLGLLVVVGGDPVVSSYIMNAFTYWYKQQKGPEEVNPEWGEIAKRIRAGWKESDPYREDDPLLVKLRRIFIRY